MRQVRAIAVLLSGALLSLPAAAASIAVVANYHDHTAAIVDTTCRPTWPATCTPVVATVAVGTHPYGVAVHPDGNFAYVTNSWDNTVSMIDVPRRLVVATIPVGSLPYGVAVDAATGSAYVSALAGHSVTVIGPAHDVIATIAVPNPHGLAVSPDGRYLYAGDYGNGALSVIDTAAREVVAQVPVGGLPVGIAVHPSGTPVFVASFTDRRLVAIDAATWKVVGHADVGAGAAGVALGAGGAIAYVSNMEDYSVSIVRTRDMVVLATVPVGSGPLGIGVDPDGRSVYVANAFDNNLAVIDTASRAVVANLPVGAGPYSHGAIVAGASGPGSGLADLLRALEALALPRGVAMPLAQFLRQALAAQNAGAQAKTCERLARFADAVRQARATRRIGAAAAELLLRDARDVATRQGCA